MSQNHFTIKLPLKSKDASKILRQLLPTLMTEFFKAADKIGTIHYSRFTFLNDEELLFLADFDGDFNILIKSLSVYAGTIFDTIFQYVANPPVGSVSSQPDAFVIWALRARIQPVNLYSAYPNISAKEIKALVLAANVQPSGVQRPFLVVLPTKSKFSYFMVQLLLKGRGKGITTDLDKVGTPHFAQFVKLGNNQIGFFTAYDGTFDTYIADFTKNIGQVFDLLFKFTKNAPPSPCRKHLQEFIDFATGANREPIGFYSAYPGFTVQDIHALIADSKSAA
jgi:hypothetical protein